MRFIVKALLCCIFLVTVSSCGGRAHDAALLKKHKPWRYDKQQYEPFKGIYGMLLDDYIYGVSGMYVAEQCARYKSDLSTLRHQAALMREHVELLLAPSPPLNKDFRYMKELLEKDAKRISEGFTNITCDKILDPFFMKMKESADRGGSVLLESSKQLSP